VRDELWNHAEGSTREVVEQRLAEIADSVDRDCDALLKDWPATVEAYSGEDFVYAVRDREVHVPLTRETLSGTKVPRVALPRTSDHGDLLTFLRSENLPGRFPYTAGVFPFKRDGEAPARMFAG